MAVVVFNEFLLYLLRVNVLIVFAVLSAYSRSKVKVTDMIPLFPDK